MILTLPVTAAIGWGLTMWLRRADRDMLRRVMGAAAPGLVATLLLFWQTRTGPAAQMMAVVGAVAIIWFLPGGIWPALARRFKLGDDRG